MFRIVPKVESGFLPAFPGEVFIGSGCSHVRFGSGFFPVSVVLVGGRSR